MEPGTARRGHSRMDTRTAGPAPRPARPRLSPGHRPAHRSSCWRRLCPSPGSAGTGAGTSQGTGGGGCIHMKGNRRDPSWLSVAQGEPWQAQSSPNSRQVLVLTGSALHPCPFLFQRTSRSEPRALQSTARAPRCLPAQDAAEPSRDTAPVSQSSVRPLPLALPGLAMHGEERRSPGTLPAPSSHPEGTTMPVPCALAARASRLGEDHHQHPPPRAAAAPLNPSSSQLKPYGTGKAVRRSQRGPSSPNRGWNWSTAPLPAPFACRRGLLGKAEQESVDALGVGCAPCTPALPLSRLAPVHGLAPSTMLSSRQHRHGWAGTLPQPRTGEQCPGPAPGCRSRAHGGLGRRLDAAPSTAA